MDAVYLDYAATTPVRAEVRAAMAPYESERFGNPSSLHRWGRDASAALEEARAVVSDALGARPGEIHFVRGGTESDNFAILGGCRALLAGGIPPSLLVSAIEHPAVLEAAEYADHEGLATLEVLSVGASGAMDLDAVRDSLSAGAAMVSAMWVNNETGMLLPIPELAALAEDSHAIMHTDASQAVGKVPVNVSSVPVDLLTATGHKIYGPKGIGILYVRDGVRVVPLLHGGGQERALRPGTEDVAGAIGFATALRLAVESQAAEAARLGALRDRLEASLLGSIPDARINAGEGDRAPHVSGIGFLGISGGRTLVMALDLEGVAVSGGSACASGGDEGSHVIAATYGAEDAHANVRYSLGMRSSEADIDRAVHATVAVVERLRAT